MADRLNVPLLLVTSTLENGLSLTEALNFPEVSRWGGTRRPSTQALIESLRLRIEQMDGLELARHLPPEETRLTRWEVELKPPQDVPAWSEPVLVNFYALKYAAGDLWGAYVPGLGASFFAPTEEELEQRAPEELATHLLRRRLNRLELLTFLQRIRTLVCSQVGVEVRVLSLRKRSQRRQKKPAPILRQVATDLAVEKLLPAYERTQAVDRMAQLLTGKSPRSVLLVGASGVGKSALFRELVRRRADFQLSATPFWETSGSRLMAGQTAFGMWQERCGRLVREAGKTRAIVHLGNLMELFQVGRHESSPFGMAGFFRLALARGEMLAVAECTPEQLTLLERDLPHLLEAFTRLELDAPTREESLSILMQSGHDAGFRGPIETVEMVERLFRRFAAYSAFPGRALRFLLALSREDRQAGPAAAARAFARDTGLPDWLLDDSQAFDPAEARDWFSGRVLGQPEAVELVVDRLAALKAGLTRPARPIASFLMIGPTGVGKTETARALAEYLFGDRNRLVRFDMSEFSDPRAVERLVGEEGLLTARVREHPFSVVLFDELEKAHPDFFDLLLQVLGEARLTDASGRLADFSNSVVLMTSNLGAQEFARGSLGLRSQTSSAQEAFTAAVRSALRPELFNRLDRILAFAPLGPETILAIARRELDQVSLRDGLRRRPVGLELAEGAAERLAELGYDPRYGARPLKRALERTLMAPLAHELNNCPPELGLEIAVDADLALHTKIVSRDGEARLRSASASVDRVSATRRQGRQIAQGPLVIGVINELHAFARRKKKLTTEFHPAQPLIDRLERWRAAVEGLEERSLLELAESLRGAPFGLQSLMSEHHRLERELDELLLAFYERGHPGRLVTLGIYAGRADQVMFLARAYGYVAKHYGWDVKLESLRLLKGEKKSPVERREEKDPEKFLSGQHQVLGVLMQLEGRLAEARIRGESGPVSFVMGRETQAGMLDAQPLALRGEKDPERFVFHAPEGLHRQGFFSVQPRARSYDFVRRRLVDARLGQTRDWGETVHEIVLTLLEQRLRKEVLEAAMP